MKILNGQPKHRPAFMLIEVMISLAIIAISSVSIFNLQSHLLSLIWQKRSRQQHFLALKNLFYEPQLQQLNLEEPTKQVPSKQFLNLKYQIKELSPQSALSGFFSNLYVIQAEGSWQDGAHVREGTLISFKYLPPKAEVKA